MENIQYTDEIDANNKIIYVEPFMFYYIKIN